jgi:hypothetical protein
MCAQGRPVASMGNRGGGGQSAASGGPAAMLDDDEEPLRLLSQCQCVMPVLFSNGTFSSVHVVSGAPAGGRARVRAGMGQRAR